MVAQWPAAEGEPNSSMGFVVQGEFHLVVSPSPPPETQCIAAAMAAAGENAEEAAVCTACLGIEVDQIP